MNVEIKIAEETELEKWDELVESSPHGMIFHTWKWLRIMEKYTGTKLYPLIGFKGTTPIGVYPLFYQKRYLTRIVFSPPPNTGFTYLGPLIVDYNNLKEDKRLSTFSEFHTQVDRFIVSKLKADYVLISLPPGLIDCRPFKWTGYQIVPAYNYLIELSMGTNHIGEKFKSSFQGERTEKEGIYVEECSKEDFYSFYDLFMKMQEEQNGLIIPQGYLIELFDLFPQNVKVFVVKQEDKVVDGAIFLCHGERLIKWDSGTMNTKGAPLEHIIVCEAIKWASKHGFKYYEESRMSSREDEPKFNYDLLEMRFVAEKYSFSGKVKMGFAQTFKSSERRGR